MEIQIYPIQPWPIHAIPAARGVRWSRQCLHGDWPRTNTDRVHWAGQMGWGHGWVGRGIHEWERITGLRSRDGDHMGQKSQDGDSMGQSPGQSLQWVPVPQETTKQGTSICCRDNQGAYCSSALALHCHCPAIAAHPSHLSHRCLPMPMTPSHPIHPAERPLPSLHGDPTCLLHPAPPVVDVG